MAHGVLTNHGVELVKLVCGLTASRPADAETLRTRCDNLLGDYVARCQRAGVGAEAVQNAKYAFVALIDERILRSDLPITESWLSSPLQMRHFDSFAAGEEFYARLERYRHPQAPEAADVLEVYHLCLCLGFAGKFGDDKGRERRRLLVEQITGEIQSARGTAGGELSPRWQPTGAAARPPQLTAWNGLPIWSIPIVLGVVVLLAALAMDALIGSRVESFTRDFPVR